MRGFRGPPYRTKLAQPLILFFQEFHLYLFSGPKEALPGPRQPASCPSLALTRPSQELGEAGSDTDAAPVANGLLVLIRQRPFISCFCSACPELLS